MLMTMNGTLVQRVKKLMMTWVLGGLCVVFLGIGSVYANKLTLIHHLHVGLQPALSEMLREIGDRHNVEIELVRVSDFELMEKTFVMAAGGQMPDIVRVDQQHIRALTVAGLLEDLTPYLNREQINLHEDFIPLTADAFAYNGKQYALPAETSSLGIFYNTAMFDGAGLMHPSSDWQADGRWLWEDFEAASRRLTIDASGAGNARQYGISNVRDIYYWPWQWGADWVDESFETFTGDSPHVTEQLQKLADLRTVHDVVGGNFHNGTAAMIVSGNWEFEAIKSSGNTDWDLGVYPQGTTRTTVFYPNGFSISSTSKHKDVAWEIIKALTLEEEIVQRYTELAGRIPSHRSMWENYLATHEQLFPGKQHRVFLEGILFAKTWTMRFATNWAEIDAALKETWKDVWNGRKSAAQAMIEIAPTINGLLQDAKKLELP